MKFYIVVLFCSLFSLPVQAQKNTIDQLKTNDDVVQFLKHSVDAQFKKEHIFTSEKDSTRYGKNTFVKLDLDANGWTDLLINGKYLFAVMASGDETYQMHVIDRGAFLFRKYTVVTIDTSHTPPFIIIKPDIENSIAMHDAPPKVDTLIFKYGDFIEYNPNPSSYQIEKLTFNTSGCLGSCPIYTLTIFQTNQAVYDAKQYNEIKGKFTAQLDSQLVADLFALLNYIDFPQLDSRYSVNWTDDRTGTLRIQYNNQQIKHIRDYGMIGTFGLHALYNQLSALRTTQKWQ